MAANNSIKVRIFSLHSLKSLTISSPQPWKLLLPETQSVKNIPVGKEIQIDVTGSQLVISGEVSFQAGNLILKSTPQSYLVFQAPASAKKKYSGEIRVGVKQGHLLLIQRIPLETYVLGVLAREMPEDFPLEAQKAQAVAIRSYTLAQGSRHPKEAYHFCDSTHCQTYGGQEAAPIFISALRQTKDLILTHRDHSIHSYYHSTCGGHTSGAREVFGGPDLPYLQRVEDKNYCAASPHTNWETTLSGPELNQIYQPNFAPAPNGTFRVTEGEPEGRIFSMLWNPNQPIELNAQEFLTRSGRRLGWSRIKSAWFEILPQGEVYQLKGRGLGHGVGLCQWGARGMALTGQSFEGILSHYFPHTRLSRSKKVYNSNKL